MSLPNVTIGIHRLLLRLDRVRLLFILCADALIAALAFILAIVIRFEFSLPSAYLRLVSLALVVWPLSKVLIFFALRNYQRPWRSVSIQDLYHLLLTNVLASAFIAALGFGLHLGVHRSVWVVDFLLCVAGMATLRVSARLIHELGRFQPAPVKQCRAVIYGAGAAGIALLRELRQNKALEHRVCGFIDDRKKKGSVIHGVPVLGKGTDLSSVASRYGVEIVLIAIPSATGPQMCRILEHCQTAGLKSKTVPGLAQRMEGREHELRDVAVEDLLGRSPVRLDGERIAQKLEGNVVLVTGAGGSIGSELCRQIARFRPACIVGFEIAETPLFKLQQEMRRIFPDVPFYPAIGSIQNQQRLAEVFDKYRPLIVYHAAAYKHVPMMEVQSFEAVENNVFGTLNVALTAAQFGVAEFVMISSDKAVRPTNVMGATKRVAELVIRSMQNDTTNFVSVRFGNVLGSNGSVVPIFKEQIARGGPVTITHPDMRRFFMTIPEACQLVLQSSTMGKGGEIFVLDMGAQVRIVDLARNLILLSGFQPDQDIAIEFTGVRPGEKLYEEVSALNEDTVPTYHEKIQIFAGACSDWPTLDLYIKQLETACATRNLKSLILTLKDIVPEYNPSNDLLREVLERRPASRAVAASGR